MIQDPRVPEAALQADPARLGPWERPADLGVLRSDQPHLVGKIAPMVFMSNSFPTAKVFCGSKSILGVWASLLVLYYRCSHTKLSIGWRAAPTTFLSSSACQLSVHGG